MTTRKATLLLLLISALLVSCQHNVVYTSWQAIPERGWNADSSFVFTWPIEDTVSTYDIILYVRHRETYPYQNMWLFLSDSLHRDTIEFYLADDRGLWLGNGKNGLMEMPVLYEQDYVFTHSGRQFLSLQQGMREDWLKGVSDIGISVVRHGEK